MIKPIAFGDVCVRLTDVRIVTDSGKDFSMASGGPIIKKKERLQVLAAEQFGYFTAEQAIRLGYARTNHPYHVKNNHWIKVSTGLFRLTGYPDIMESDYAKWSLWSRNQQDQPQAIISHESALAFHGFADYDPESIHITVPPRFRKKVQKGIVIHKDSLNLSAIERHHCFLVTRLGQTLLDMQPTLEKESRWKSILTHVENASSLSGEELDQLDVSDKFGNKVLRKEQLNFNSQKQMVDGHRGDPVSKGVWNMIYNRTDFYRRRSIAGFTLVELLVVISIISILASMLLPSLAKAMNSAVSIQCSGNQKQVALAITQYADEYDSNLPYLGGQSNLTFWNFPLLDYLGMARKSPYNPGNIFYCPAYTPTETEISSWIRTYGINPNIINRKWGMKLNTVKNPSKIFLYGDKFPSGADYILVPVDPVSNYWGVYGVTSGSHGVWTGSSARVADYWRHNDAVNFAFCDGHVESKYPEDICRTKSDLIGSNWAWFNW